MSTTSTLVSAPRVARFEGTLAQLEQQWDNFLTKNQAARQKATIWYIGMWVALVGAVIGLMSARPLMMIPAVVIAIGFAVAWLAAGYYELETRKIEVTRAITQVLQSDLHPNRALTMRVSFADYSKDRQWLHLQMPLANGIGLTVLVETWHKRKQRPKRKYTKIKDKIRERVTVNLSPPKGQFFDPSIQARIPTIRVPGLSLRGVKVTPKVASFNYITPLMLRVRGRYGWTTHNDGCLLDTRRLLDAVLWSYRGLAQATGSDGSVAPGPS